MPTPDPGSSLRTTPSASRGGRASIPVVREADRPDAGTAGDTAAGVPAEATVTEGVSRAGSSAPAAPARQQAGATISTDEWLRLLIAVTTCLVLVLAIGVAVRLMGFIHHTLLLFALGGLLAYALDPLVEGIRGGVARRAERWRRHGAPKPAGTTAEHAPEGGNAPGTGHAPEDGTGRRPRWFGVVVVYLLLVGLLVVAGILLGTTLVHQGERLAQDRALYEAKGRDLLTSTDRWMAARHIPVDLQQYLDHPPADWKNWGQTAATGVLGEIKNISTSVVESGVVLLIGLYFLIYSEEMRRRAIGALPAHVQPYAEQWRQDVNRVLGGFIRGQIVLAATLGALAAVGCALLGIKIWLLIGLFVTVVSLIPVFGPYIGAVPAVLAAAITPAGVFSPLVRVILVVVLFIVINEVGSKILYPRLVGAALGLHEIVVLFVLFAGFEVGKILGALFAAPVTALAIVTVNQLYRFWQGEPPASLSPAAREDDRRAGSRSDD